MSGIVNTRFIISNNQTAYADDEVFVSFQGAFGDSGQEQTLGTNVITEFSSIWCSHKLSYLQAEVTDVPYLNGQTCYTFSLNSFVGGRIFISYGKELTGPPNPASEEVPPYILFEATVDGSAASSNMDLSYVDGVSGQACTQICDGTTGDALLAASVNPVVTQANVMKTVANAVPAAAQILDDKGKLVRVASSHAKPSAYHTWTNLMNQLEGQGPLSVKSYCSATNSKLVSKALSNVLFGYSGAAAISGQMPGFEKKGSYDLTATFTADLNPSNNELLSSKGINSGAAGVIIAGTAKACSSDFAIYITESKLNLGTGIYGSNPGYTVAWPKDNPTNAYSTPGIINDLGGRIVGDLMAGLVFGWSASTMDIAAQASATSTDLYGTDWTATKINGLGTGEYFFLLSLAGMQEKLNSWLGSSIDNNPDNYDPYLEVVAQNSDAYGSPFTDRLQGYLNPDTYWYTSNPPAIPGDPTKNYPLVGYVNLYLGGLTGPTPAPTNKVHLTLSNTGNAPLQLMNRKINGVSDPTDMDLPLTLAAGANLQGTITPPAGGGEFEAEWTYSPDGGVTTLEFTASINGTTLGTVHWVTSNENTWTLAYSDGTFTYAN